MHDVLDATFDERSGRIVMVSRWPSYALYVYDVTSGIERSVPLPNLPAAVAIEKSGATAAVGSDKSISWIDLAGLTLEKTCPVAWNVADLELTSTGSAYFVDRSSSTMQLRTIRLATCAEDGSQGHIWGGSRLALHPTEKAIFAIASGVPTRVDRCDLTKSPSLCNDSQGTSDWGTYPYCQDLWPSPDGRLILTGCGVALTVPLDVTGGACTYGGALEGERKPIEHLYGAPAARRIASIPKVALWAYPANVAPIVDTLVRIHDADTLKAVGQVALPPFPSHDGVPHVSHGRWVFSSATMDRLFVVVRKDPERDLAKNFAIVTVAP